DKVKVLESFGDGPFKDALQNFAQKYQIFLFAGTFPMAARDPLKVLNASLVFNPEGQCIARYDKIHLFGFQTSHERYKESETIESGSQPTTVRIFHEGNEWRFPELYRQQAEVDCQVIPAAFTHTTGKDHWEILLRARAIENQCYFLASAQGGLHQNQRRTWGQSMLVDPWGNIVSELPTGEGYVLGELDSAVLEEVRSKLPALKHRKLSR
ncbi:MAG: hypothetical protein RIQ30_1467, partial [Pseudomonadota bacterium]